jgi:hypothetical protein
VPAVRNDLRRLTVGLFVVQVLKDHGLVPPNVTVN